MQPNGIAGPCPDHADERPRLRFRRRGPQRQPWFASQRDGQLPVSTTPPSGIRKAAPGSGTALGVFSSRKTTLRYDASGCKRSRDATQPAGWSDRSRERQSSVDSQALPAHAQIRFNGALPFRILVEPLNPPMTVSDYVAHHPLQSSPHTTETVISIEMRQYRAVSDLIPSHTTSLTSSRIGSPVVGHGAQNL